ncbi:hypothetical protein Sjap_001997 [Stephania japonica]|uniref:Uncharacterized protein n=1 Tax=Stephania japonica TaxID=461633 RepID=A0AAP0KNA9_9MAGN
MSRDEPRSGGGRREKEPRGTQELGSSMEIAWPSSAMAKAMAESGEGKGVVSLLVRVGVGVESQPQR